MVAMCAAEPRRMALASLSECCAAETEHFFHDRASDARYCFELFRRALAKGDQLAWEAVYRQYSSLVAGWIAGHPELYRAGGEIQDYVNSAFARMWAARTRKFRNFSDLRSVLAYLKMCANSAVIEDARKAGAISRIVALEDWPAEAFPTDDDGVDSPLDRALFTRDFRERLWNTVNARLQNNKERLVVHCLFELNLKPRAIYDGHSRVFRDVREVYLIRQVVLERLSRDPNLRALLSDDA